MRPKQSPADNNKYQAQEKCACSCKCFTSIVVALAIIALIIGVLYLLISFSGMYINTTNEMSVYNTLDHINGNIDVSDGNYNRLTWPFALVFSVAICAVTFIICRILSVLKDIIENEQVNRHYNH